MIHVIGLAIPEASWVSLDVDPYTYVEADLTFDGVALARVGVRVKGRLGSFRELTQKTAFKIEADEFVDDQSLHGLEHLHLNNQVSDDSKVHDRLAYIGYRAVGIPAPRVAYGRLTVNGLDFGLHALVEDYDEHFLERTVTPDGNLYDGDYYMEEPPFGDYFRVDFEPTVDDYFDQDEGEDVGLADIFQVTQNASDWSTTDNFDEALEELVDFEDFFVFWAVESWVSQRDGYSMNQNNYRVYFEPPDGRLRFFPWDHDAAFTEWYTTSPDDPRGVIAKGCWLDEGCRARFLQVAPEVFRTLDAVPWEEELDFATALIEDDLRTDPRKEESMATIHAAQADVRAWFPDRTEALEALFGL